jgi:hypothetical protein
MASVGLRRHEVTHGGDRDVGRGRDARDRPSYESSRMIRSGRRAARPKLGYSQCWSALASLLRYMQSGSAWSVERGRVLDASGRGM